jgi:PAS domain S-box-containing protein
MRGSENFYRSLFEKYPVPTLVFGLNDLSLQAANQAAAVTYGYPPGEFPRLSLPDLIPDYDSHCLRDSSSPTNSEDFRRVLRQRKKDGAEFSAELIARRVVQPNGQSSLVLLIHRVEAPLERMPEFSKAEIFSKAFHSCPLAITVAERDSGKYIEVNDAFLRLVGCNRKQALGHTIDDLKLWSNPDTQTRFIRELAQRGKVAGVEAAFRTRKDGERMVRLFAESIHLDGVPCVLMTYSDVTEAKSIQEQLNQAQKMEAVGRLAGGVAHDFNNVLGVIIGYCDLILQQSSPELALQYIERIRRSAEKAIAMTRRILAFSRQGLIHASSIELNTLVRDLSLMLRRLIGENVDLVLKLEEGLAGMKADVGQIEQLIMNLVVNARDAMPEGGKLFIETANVQVDGTYSRQFPEVRPGSYVMLQVSDTGWGIEADILPHIFEPFFTTKVPGKGTGLGLAIVYGVVKQSEGNIWVYSDSGRGTTFKIYFPRVDAPAKKAGDLPLRNIKATGSETVLLVEDDESLREVTRKVLETNGYSVIEAVNSVRAIEIAEKHKGKIDILLTDLVMPGMSGIQLSRILIARDPALRVLYTSGYAGELVPEPLSEDSPFLEKPFSQNALLRQVRTVLDGKEPSAKRRQFSLQ